jgi:protein SCO1
MRRPISAATAFLCMMGFAIVAEAHDGPHHGDAGRSSGPASAYAFALPEPGSYRLPPIRAAAGGPARMEDGSSVDLAPLLRDHITVFSFIYTRCADICPVATMQLAQLRELARRHHELDGRLRLVSMSFDPDHDTPGVMAEYGSWWRDPDDGGAEWLFLAAADSHSLGAILTAYDQAVAPKPDPDDPTGGLSHILRVFLIDEAGVIRNIYSLDFLDPDLVLTDIRTLLGGGPIMKPRTQ